MKQGKEISYSKPAELNWLVETSRYGKQIEPWVEHFGRDRIHAVSFDELRSCPEKLLGEISDFLGLSESPPPPNRRHNVTEGRLNTSIWNMVRRVGAIRKAYRSVVSQGVRSEIKRFFNPSIYEGMKIEEREWKKYLYDVREDVKKMEEFGIDTSSWDMQ